MVYDDDSDSERSIGITNKKPLLKRGFLFVMMLSGKPADVSDAFAHDEGSDYLAVAGDLPLGGLEIGTFFQYSYWGAVNPFRLL